jgi:hypothetical protein
LNPWLYLSLGGAVVAVFCFIVLLVLMVWGHREAPSYWD